MRKYCTEYAHDDGHEDIPDAVEDSAATKPGWQGVPVDETDRYRGNDRREHAPKTVLVSTEFQFEPIADLRRSGK